MALSNAICPKCNGVNAVESTQQAWVCENCRTSFFTAPAIAAWDCAYVVILNRKSDPVIGNDITFVTVYRGNYSPLSDGATLQLLVSEKEFEIPVLITDNEGNTFEGVLTGSSDGKDIEITWEAKRDGKQLGCIAKTSNDTVRFVERPGAAKNQRLHQE